MQPAFLAAALAVAPLGPVIPQPDAPATGVTSQGEIQVVVGDRITVRLRQDGHPEQVSVEHALPGAAALPKPGPGGGRFEDAPQGTVVFTLQQVDQGDVLMKVQSGIDQAFDYRAKLVHPVGPGRWLAEPTSVCTVLPLLTGYEHWPKRGATSGIVLSDLRLRNTNEVVCPQPSRSSQ